jgi:addiction module HigA family antidote
MARLPIHPGEILADELEELGINASQLAHALNVPPNRVTQILRGERGITAETALRLGHWLGTSPEFWLNLQKAYELRRAEQEVGAEIAQTIQPVHSYEPDLVAHI